MKIQGLAERKGGGLGSHPTTTWTPPPERSLGPCARPSPADGGMEGVPQREGG